MTLHRGDTPDQSFSPEVPLLGKSSIPQRNSTREFPAAKIVTAITILTGLINILKFANISDASQLGSAALYLINHLGYINVLALAAICSFVFWRIKVKAYEAQLDDLRKKISQVCKTIDGIASEGHLLVHKVRNGFFESKRLKEVQQLDKASLKKILDEIGEWATGSLEKMLSHLSQQTVYVSIEGFSLNKVSGLTTRNLTNLGKQKIRTLATSKNSYPTHLVFHGTRLLRDFPDLWEIVEKRKGSYSGSAGTAYNGIGWRIVIPIRCENGEEDKQENRNYTILGFLCASFETDPASGEFKPEIFKNIMSIYADSLYSIFERVTYYLRNFASHG